MTVAPLDAALALELADIVVRPRYSVPSRRGRRLQLLPARSAPDASNLAGVRKWAQGGGRPTAIDLFSGAGGLSLGLRDAGFRVLVAADSDSAAVETHTANLGGLGYVGDLSDPSDFLEHLSAWGIGTVDLLAGGVPCQPFSRAGRSKIRSLVEARVRPMTDARVDLWQSFIAVVRKLKPRAVLLENVPDLAQWDDGAVLIGFCESLRELGYRSQAKIVNAYDHGVPQHRSRLFVVGLKDSTFTWPKASHKCPTLWDAISDLPPVPPGHRDEKVAYAGPTTPLQKRLRRGIRTRDRGWLWDHITRAVRPDDAEAFAALSEGGTYLDVPEHLRRYRSDIFTDKYKRLARNELSRTITAHMAKDGYWYIHPLQDRTLSVREAARVQTFPDWFRFAGEPSHRYRQIGNAVPPLLAESIGRALRASLHQEQTQTVDTSPREFREDLLGWHTKNARSYRWREGAGAWAVLLAEMCLHRTRADQVATVYERLLSVAPTPAEMVERAAEAREVMASLGLKWRVDNIVEVASVLLSRHQGQVPRSRDELLELPGVGEYVANAVICFGFGQIAVLMDTNTERIVARVTGNGLASRRWQMRLDLYRLAGVSGPNQDFNYALLDLGALVCRAGNPRCDSCPVRRHCVTGASAARMPTAI
jgi:DNA (cytosine-5)-methyltransferase 1